MDSSGFETVVARLEAAADRSGRDASLVTLVVISKERTPEEIMTIYDLGHRDFGENRPEAMEEKALLLPDDIRWHFVGTLQRRKSSLVRARTSFLHSMDRLSLARRWIEAGSESPPCLLQVNIGEEEQKHGILATEASRMLSEMADIGIHPVGLMAIPPAPAIPEDSRPYFRRLAQLARHLKGDHPLLTEISMGMTDDFEVGIEEGATLIRVGRAIFGPRIS